VEKMNRKTTAISLILLTTLAAAVGALTITTFAAADTNSTIINAGTAVTSDTSQYANQMQFDGNMMMDSQGFGGFSGGPRGHGGHGGEFMGNIANIEVSSEYTANVNTILTTTLMCRT
jgi:phosphate-selective porin